MISSITQWVLRHRRLVIGFWVVLTLIGGAASRPASKAMDQKFSGPGKEGWGGKKEIEQRFHGTGGNAGPLVPVVALKSGDAASVRADLQRLEQTVKRTLPGARVAGYGSTGDKAFVSKDGKTAYVIAYPPPDPDQPFGDHPKAEKKLRAALAGVAGAGGAGHPAGYDAPPNQTRGHEGARRPPP